MLDSDLTPWSPFRVEKIPSPGSLLSLLEERCPREPLFFWAHPEADREMLGLGIAAEITARGPHRFTEASARARELLAPALQNEARSPDAPLPCVVGGFGFADRGPSDHGWRELPACRLVIPAALWIRHGENCWLVRADEINPYRERATIDPDRRQTAPAATETQASWEQRVRQALATIERGGLSKVVLSRANPTRFAHPPNLVRVVDTLTKKRPGCFTHWIHGAETDFFGSTPELLVRTQGRAFATESVAGTMARGATEAEDEARAAELLASDKNRREQAAVTNALRQKLRQCARHFEIDRQVKIRTVPEAHHLASCFRGTLDTDRSALELAGILHPTPAVCGAPGDEARVFIEKSDGDRGWFTGACGWMDASGSGEWAVSLRSALVDGDQITTFAGAGIVAGSVPEDEYEETRLKLRALESLWEGKR